MARPSDSTAVPAMAIRMGMPKPGRKIVAWQAAYLRPWPSAPKAVPAAAVAKVAWVTP